jgi:hypothetical protein
MWCGASYRLLATHTWQWFLLHQDTSLGAMVGKMLKCEWWLCGGLMSTICYPCAVYTSMSEWSSWHQSLLPCFLKILLLLILFYCICSVYFVFLGFITHRIVLGMNYGSMESVINVCMYIHIYLLDLLFSNSHSCSFGVHRPFQRNYWNAYSFQFFVLTLF